MKNFIRLTLRQTFFLFLFAALATFAETSKEFLVYFGTAGKNTKGIYVSRLNTSTGKLTTPELAAEVKASGFLAVHPNRKFLYAIGELGKPGDKPTGAVNAFSIDAKTGKLTFLNQQSCGGKGPAHLVVDHTGKSVLVANYGGGNLAAIRIEKDGKLGEQTAFIQHTGSSVNPARQSEPHAHSINVDSANHFAFVADLGLDKVMIYKFNPEKGSLVVNDPPFATVKPGSGPRHFTFHPGNRFAYVINEMACTMTALKYDAARGELTEVQTVSTLPEGVEVVQGFSTAEVVAHPTGKFLYGSNRGHDTIAVFEVDAATGKLKLIQNEPTQGKIPRNFNVDPTGHFLIAANQNSDNVVVFNIDLKTGRLSPTEQKFDVPMPMCIKFVELDSPDLPKVARWPGDDEFPGKGPIQKSPWFAGLWASRRTDWWNHREKDKGAVVFLGDSITQGWTSLAKDFPNYKVANRGISGDTTRGVWFRLKEDVLDLDPQAVVLLIGTNDLGLNGNPEEVAENIRGILLAIRSRSSKTHVIVCKVMPSSDKMFRPADKIKKLNELLDEIVKSDSHFTPVDTWSLFADDTGNAKKEEFPDLLHPNATGYAKWTAALKPVLAKLVSTK